MPQIKPCSFRTYDAFYVITQEGKYIHADGKTYEYTHGNDENYSFYSHNMKDYGGWFETREEAEEAVEKYTAL